MNKKERSCKCTTRFVLDIDTLKLKTVSGVIYIPTGVITPINSVNV